MPSSLLQLLSSSSLLFTLYTAASANKWYNCSTSNFTTNSTYRSNLQLLLPSLSSAAIPTGFSAQSRGRPPNQVFSSALCRGDVSQSECQSCLSSAVDDMPQYCPLSRRGALWYDTCFLYYSTGINVTSSSKDNETIALKKQRWFENEGQNSSNPRFAVLLADLMAGLTKRAAYGSALLFATGEVNVTSSERLYGLVQCTRDQSDDDCNQCLQRSMEFMSTRFPRSVGAETLAYSCYVRHAMYAFYDESVDAAPASSPVPMPVPYSSSPPFRQKEPGKPNRVMVIPILCGLVILSAIFFCLWRRRTFFKLSKTTDTEDEEIKDVKDLLFDLGTLRVATDNFSDMNKLGEGGFGPVYKGILSDGQQIAVKRLSRRSRQGFIELRNEVMFVAKLEHRNLVKLLGCCLEEREKLLVYEFLPNTSLDKFLFDPTKRGLLDWGKRYKIIEGIARGILYLHQDSRLKIIHRDLKPSNVLLDQYMNPKISDFGLAKLSESEKTHGLASKIAGTNGYMAPEYAMQGHFSTKSDVFSFGVLILEIVTGQRIGDFHGSGCATNLLSYVWEHWSKDMALQIIDHSLGELYHRQEALTCIHIGLLCVQEDSRKRPCMQSVVLMLSNYSIALPTPSMPAYFVPSRAATDSNVTSRIADSSPTLSSMHNTSITEIEPR
ncbi:cysteine-rich receptor-like protein kinase 10 [Elaeis guineensis]|uniref:Receptor-like protein kinase At4g00960 n=1 Tax=Elaeis guineensis var. tenera TaxID=51953 RepID=A0A6I9RBT7_ELAGV|nr:putative receptor-like protein kinase At4g00960 [Elaeis guineensis]